MSARSATLAAFFFAALYVSAGAWAQAVQTPSAGRRRAVLQRQHCQPGVVASQADVIDVVADTCWIYFGDFSGNLRRVAKSGGTPELLLSMPGTWITFLELDETDIYFQSRNLSSDRDSVYVMPKVGGTATPLVRDVQYAWDMSVADGWLYALMASISGTSSWPSNGRIVRAKKDGSAVETLATGLRGAMGMKVDKSHVYYTESGDSPFDSAGGVRRIPKNGGVAETIATIPGAWSLAQDDASLYVLSVSQGERNAFIDSVTKDGGITKTLVTGISFEMFEPMEVWNGSLYFMNLVAPSTARIEAVPVSGGERRTFPDFQFGFRLFGVDSCGVYLITPTAIERISH